LLLAGRTSDQAGRRPVMAASLGFSAASAVLFIFASSPGWLYPARVLSGVSAGLMIGTATAALTEMVRESATRRASLVAASVSTGAAALGPLMAGLFAQFLPRPTVLVFEVFLGLLAAAALAYEQVLAANAEPGDPTPNFDVHLLGMGPEGHINSLFPDTPAVREATRMVVSVEDSPKPPPERITLTLPAIRRSREVWLMVSGAAKAEAAAAAIGGADPISIPAAGAIGLETTLWLLDEEAAAELPG